MKKQSLGNVSVVVNGNSVLAETLQNRIDAFEAFVYIASCFGASEHDLAVHEDQKNDSRFDHAIDEAREEFGFVGTELLMHLVEFFEANGETQVDGGHEILDLEVNEFYLKRRVL